MSEMRGLADIIGNAGTLHGIDAPPFRVHFVTDEEYEAAYREWWTRINCWHAEIRKLA